ncbi:MAG: efflux RND transporter periplasmic adaptor subunit [Acidobacteriales bacterium]|nr:efflux RND transporter periplasmic adaptor subunit [Terriglobales bacterium]
MNKRALFVGIATVLIFAVATFVWKHTPAQKTQVAETSDPNMVELTPELQQTGDIKTEAVVEQQITKRVKITGSVSPDETKLAHIAPLGQGLVEEVYVRLGDRVRKGQPLLQYDNIELGELISEHLTAHSELERARAQAQVAVKALDRANNLIGVEAISPRDFELRKAEQQSALADIASKQAQLARVEEKLHRFGLSEQQVSDITKNEGGHRTASETILRAPFDGIVIKYDVGKGELVGQNKELFTIADTANVWVQGDVYEKDLGSIPSTGDCIVNVSSYADVPFRGKITYLGDFLDPNSRTAKLRCVVPNNDGRLKLEMFADMVIPTKSSTTVLMVPKSAIQEVNGDSVVFVRKDATHFEKRSVKLGGKGDNDFHVISGLRVGEQVVTQGSFYLKTAIMRGSIGEE